MFCFILLFCLYYIPITQSNLGSRDNRLRLKILFFLLGTEKERMIEIITQYMHSAELKVELELKFSQDNLNHVIGHTNYFQN